MSISEGAALRDQGISLATDKTNLFEPSWSDQAAELIA